MKSVNVTKLDGNLPRLEMAIVRARCGRAYRSFVQFVPFLFELPESMSNCASERLEKEMEVVSCQTIMLHMMMVMIR